MAGRFTLLGCREPQTIDQMKNLSDSNSSPVYIRVPKPGQKCPYTGLSRSSMYKLTPPTDSPVAWISYKQNPKATRGIRLIDLASLREHLSKVGQHPKRTEENPTASEACAPPRGLELPLSASRFQPHWPDIVEESMRLSCMMSSELGHFVGSEEEFDEHIASLWMGDHQSLEPSGTAA